MDNELLLIDIKDSRTTMTANMSSKILIFQIPKGSFSGYCRSKWFREINIIKTYSWTVKKTTRGNQAFWQDISRFKEWEKIGYVSQKANSFNTGFPATVYEVVKSGLTKKIGLFHYMNKEQHKEKVYRCH